MAGSDSPIPMVAAGGPGAARRRLRVALWLAWVLVGSGAPTCGADVGRLGSPDILSGGAGTNVRRLGRDAFSEPSANMRFDKRRDFFLGNGLFHRNWTPSAGLGPLYNATGCHRCHVRDGRGRPVEASGATGASLVVRFALPVTSSQGAGRDAAGDSTYGAQLQTLAVDGVSPEGRLAVDYTERSVTLADGHTVRLREPRYRITALAHGPLDPRTVRASRVAPPVIGLGLLEAVAEADILGRADPDDEDGDGISGRANRVFSPAQARTMLGRFGWKAAQPTLVDQAAAALSKDMGMSTPLRPEPAGDCTPKQRDCLAAVNGSGVPEMDAASLDLLVFYSRQLAVPRRRDTGDPYVQRGEAIFHESGCAGCHTPVLTTRADWPLPALADQVIRPYTDLLLHDMGDGLADGHPEGRASGREWRTAPLWGIGLTETVSGHTYFLHDGRARSLLEAILWHGGEARAARDAVRRLTSGDRRALLAFLESL